MIGAGAMLLQCRPRTSAESEVPSRISMKSYLVHKKRKKGGGKSQKTEVMSRRFKMFSHKRPSENKHSVYVDLNAAGRDYERGKR